MKKNQNLIPHHHKIDDNRLYVQLNPYFLQILREAPEYNDSAESFDSGTFRYDLTEEELYFYEKGYFLLDEP
ncbi:MAG: hypothetical protein KDI92_12020, partial [Xanthomonadales bacterium]|nr:hypothetical protein [Xanthomonadales bacterium]